MLLRFQSCRTSNSIIIVMHVFQVGSRMERTVRLLVSNIPFTPGLKDEIETSLTILSDNCGGRVGNISRDYITRRATCAISFRSADDAERYVDAILNFSPR